MSTDPRSTPMSTPTFEASPTEVRGRASDSFGWREHVSRETKPSLITTEFWAMILGLVALVALYNFADDPSLDLWRTCVLGTVLGTAYILSRGFAKSGSHDSWREHHDVGPY